MDPSLPRPDRDRLSAMAALVLLAYGLLRIVELPTFSTQFTLAGLLIRFDFNTRFALLSLSAALAATGTDWLLQSHPRLQGKRMSAEHGFIPALASLALGAILGRLPEGPALWLGLPIAAMLLVAVLVAEYIVVDASDPRYDLAAAGLRALAYFLLAGAFFAIKATDMRAIYGVPLTFLAGWFVSWRLQRLEGASIPTAIWQGSILAWLGGQISWALHYWPIEPLQESLLLGLAFYSGNAALAAWRQGRTGRATWLEITLVTVAGLAAILFAA